MTKKAWLLGSETPNCIAYSIPCAKANKERHAVPIAGRVPASWQRQHKRGETAKRGRRLRKIFRVIRGFAQQSYDPNPHFVPNIELRECTVFRFYCTLTNLRPFIRAILLSFHNTSSTVHTTALSIQKLNGNVFLVVYCILYGIRPHVYQQRCIRPSQ